MDDNLATYTNANDCRVLSDTSAIFHVLRWYRSNNWHVYADPNKTDDIPRSPFVVTALAMRRPNPRQMSNDPSDCNEHQPYKQVLVQLRNKAAGTTMGMNIARAHHQEGKITVGNKMVQAKN
jgi:hypothetical protein